MNENSAAIEGRVAKSSLKWVATIFAIPTVVAILSAWAFITSADYRYGSNLQAQKNASRIDLLDERTVNMKADIVRLQTDIMGDLSEIKRDIKAMNLEFTKHTRNEK